MVLIDFHNHHRAPPDHSLHHLRHRQTFTTLVQAQPENESDRIRSRPVLSAIAMEENVDFGLDLWTFRKITVDGLIETNHVCPHSPNDRGEVSLDRIPLCICARFLHVGHV